MRKLRPLKHTGSARWAAFFSHIPRPKRPGKKMVTAAGCLLAAAAMIAAVTVPAAIKTSSSQRQLPIYSVERDQKLVAISFDAAWGNEDTEQLIEILNGYNVPATFFVVGEWVDKYPESVKALFDAGMEIMNHSDTHPHMNSLSTEQIIAELESCNQKIESVTGVSPTLVRLPYGEYDDHVITACRSIGMEPIQWSVDSLDWKDLSASQITERVLNGVDSGAIVLFHNAALHTPEALPGIIEALLADGYTFVPISEIIISGEYNVDYTIDVTGRQFTK